MAPTALQRSPLHAGLGGAGRLGAGAGTERLHLLRVITVDRDRDARGHYRGQKQIWYLHRLVGRDTDVSLRASERPEFDAWRWHDYWVPLDSVIEFKREVYRRALTELERFMHAHPQTRRERLYGFPHPMMPPSYADPPPTN